MAILKISIKRYLIFFLPLALTSCYTDFDPRIDTEPVLCLNSLISAGDPIEVKVSRTWVYTDRDSAKDHSVKDAEIRIYANGNIVDSDYLPKEGDHIRVEAKSATYGSAQAEVHVPYASVSPEISYEIAVKDIYADLEPGEGVTGRIIFDINAVVNMKASPNRDTYYRLAYEPYMDYKQDFTESAEQFFSHGQFLTPDPIFSEYVSEFDEIMGYYSLYEGGFFSDHSFQGTTRPIYFQFDECRFNVYRWNPDSDIKECGYIVSLETISKSYFDWAMYYWNRTDGLLGEFSDMGLADPIWGYSNVSTGAGVVAARSTATMQIDLSDLLREAIIKAISDSHPLPRPAE